MGYQMIKQTRESGDKAFDGVRFYQFYQFNQTLSTSLWIGAGMPWVGVNHGADAPYIFNGHYTEGEVPFSDQNLAERISRSLITFAYTGNPVSSTTSKKQLGEWPSAFPESMDLTTEAPESFNVELIGGFMTQDQRF
jgi:carboxylesterase type B